MLNGLSIPAIAILMLLGVIADLVFGEVRRWHPLVGFGRYSNWIERRLNRSADNFIVGLCAWIVAVLPAVSLFLSLLSAIWVWGGRQAFWLGAIVHIALLYFSLGLRSLRDHCLPIAQALERSDLPLARRLTARIVSRDTAESSGPELARAGVESMLENGNDAVFGALFWFVLLGGPGALLFRLANTLDAMWGYRTPRFLSFGWAAARIDDALNWVPARLTALSYTLLGNRRHAWQCWHTQARNWSSPNAGPVMAAGAGALSVLLGGVASYHGKLEERPPLGVGHEAEAGDITRAWRLVASTTAWWCAVMSIIGLLIYLKG